MQRTLTLLLVLFSYTSFAQNIPADRLVDWKHAGLLDTVPSYSTVVNIMSHGGVANGVTSNNTAFQTAVAALANAPGVIYFPAGSYFFDQPISLRDSLVIRGDGTNTKLLFNLGGVMLNMINIQGSTTNLANVIAPPIAKNDNNINVASSLGISVGDWLQIYGNDVALTTSAWAAGTVGQIFRVKSIQGNTLVSHQPFRRTYDMAFLPQIKRITPVQGAGIECLYMERQDATASQTTNINFDNAVHCWVIGVESNKTNFAHIGITSSAHILVRGNYLHHAHAYGGTGQGYGAMVQYTSGDCLIENNIFEHLRHSMILQAGANGNVFSYNYSHDPFWTEPPFPANSAGDAVLHGNYAFANLFEGNILQNIVADNSHGPNGPFNTFFRNRAEGYGIFHNNTQVTDTMNYVGNEVTGVNGSGLYTITGVGHHLHGNNIKGTIQPVGTNSITELSLYLNRLVANWPPAYWNSTTDFPNIGSPATFNNTEYNIAKQRSAVQMLTDCTLNPNFIPTGGAVNNTAASSFNIYPNPASARVAFRYAANGAGITLSVSDITGKVVHTATLGSDGSYNWDCSNMLPGIYVCKLMSDAQTLHTEKLIITQ